MGALMATHLATMRPQYFKAIALMAPYYGLLNEEKFEKYRALLGTLDVLCPIWRLIPFPASGRQPRHIAHFFADSLCYSKGNMAIRNVAFSERMREELISKRVAERL
jgi:pimeloyl-ACP methyl ester carboxylesterase